MSRSYDHIATQWHSRARGDEYIKKVLNYVDRVLQDLPAGAKILDLGCGTGEPITGYLKFWELDDPTSRGHIAVIARKVLLGDPA